MSKVLSYNAKQWEILAILDGRKTVTRRVAKGIVQFDEKGKYFNIFRNGEWTGPICKEWIIKRYAPYQPGDILYVRETWNLFDCCSCEECFQEHTPEQPEGNGCFVYKATHEIYGDAKWRPSIHMPKEAARIWLKVLSVKLERLQDITANEALKEGIRPSECRTCDGAFACDCCPDEGVTERDEFNELWDSTIKKSDLDRYGWGANPYVWIVEFERCEKPEG